MPNVKVFRAMRPCSQCFKEIVKKFWMGWAVATCSRMSLPCVISTPAMTHASVCTSVRVSYHTSTLTHAQQGQHKIIRTSPTITPALPRWCVFDEIVSNFLRVFTRILATVIDWCTPPCYIAHLQRQCHNWKFVIFQEKLLKVLKCCNFLSATTTHLVSSG